MTLRVSATVTIPKDELQHVFDNLRESGFTVVGPTERDNAIVLDELDSVYDLPIGITDDQKPGHYRLRKSREATYFGFNVGPQSWKKFLYPSREKLFSVKRSGGQFAIEPPAYESKHYAFVGVRSCEVRAIELLDRVFAGSGYRDPHYLKRRQNIFVLAVNCSKAGGDCFCTSMKSGPRVEGSYDLALTELPEGFVIAIGSEAGCDALRDIEWNATTAFDLGRANNVIQQAERQITREIRTDDLSKLLLEDLESPHWRDVASRCLSCGNCTMACPTCFCSTVDDSVDLTMKTTDRVRTWDSCFTSQFSHVHGGNLRPTIRSRYRQRVTHKFASWKEQFGTLGCTGCGRCITWCPVGIDDVEEINAIRSGGAK